MSTDHRTRLANIKRFDQLIAYLRNEMSWPINEDSFEDITFEYTPEELDIDMTNAAKIQEIRRLRPLVPNQPWGIFFIKFEPKRLPLVALRRILSRVTRKRRISASSSERQTWAVEDLLFISNYGEGDARQISFAHFATPGNSRTLPTLKVLGWDNRDTALHLDAVAKELTEQLTWPDNENDADAWRKQWSTAFTLQHREVINTSKELSIRLAELAHAIRERIKNILTIETEEGRITKLMDAFQKALVHDLDADGFADMYAQTIAYGLLSARITDPNRKTVDDFAGHMRTNPLLRNLMETFLWTGGRNGKTSRVGIDFDELGIAEVVELLDNANMEAVIRDFGDHNPREDPVIHFYEHFLAAYDKEQKVSRGVFYTPRPVVSYIVRSVNELLRTEFELADGLADVSTWGEMAKRNKDLTIPEGVSLDQAFVQILDPATGTGTFLVETIDVIHGTLIEKWRNQGCRDSDIEALWNEYVPRHLLPRLHGYELLMAPYAIAHLKIGLKLYETGYRFNSEERAQVYLTNALEPAHNFSGLLDFAIPALAHEAQAVNEVKGGQRFTVVIGNPPYSGHSANKGKWIGNLLRGSVSDSQIQNYFEVDGGSLNERNPKWLNDDYVKFIRLAHWQIERTGQGVVGFITNHSYLDNPTFRGMRESLTNTFPQMFLLDLHGNAKKKERAPDGSKDENVFDIQQGVAISLLVKPTETRTSRCDHTDLWGSRERTDIDGKYGWLVTNDVSSTTWNALSPTASLWLFVPRDEALYEEYEAGWLLTDIFPVNSVGIVTARDKLAIQWTAEDMEHVVADFAARKTEDARTFYGLGKDARDWKIQLAQEDVQSGNGRICPVLYRPFDRRFTYYTGKSRGFICRPRPEVMRHMLAGENLGLISCRQQSQVGVEWAYCNVTRTIIESCAISNKTKEVNYLFPLYAYPPQTLINAAGNHVPNLDAMFIQTIETTVGFEFISDGAVDLETTFGPEEVLQYIYAVLHSPEYRCRYTDFLKSDFPRIPIPGNCELFADLTRPGMRLISLHLMEAEDTDAHATFPNTGSKQIEKVRYAPPKGGLPGRVWINGQQYFEGLEPEVWAFTIGSYRPAEKWLKDRKSRTLSDEDIDHYRKIVAALAETRRLMVEIDDVIKQHGGWPNAFQTGKTEKSS